LAGHFHTNDVPAPISPHQQHGLFADTRGLIFPFLGNTVFCRGVLAFSFVRAVPAFTIFSRRSLGNVPYLLTDLGGDLRAGTVDRATINQLTEDTIRALAADLGNLPALPLPVIVEDSSEQHYLILEGNKRFSAVALADSASLPPPCEALVGRTSLVWPQMLALFSMVPAP
jgi:hypothetical protein